MSELVQDIVKAMQDEWASAADDDPPPLDQLARAALEMVMAFLEQLQHEGEGNYRDAMDAIDSALESHHA